MAITVTCQCGKKLGVKEDMAGKKVKCPACQSVLTVPMDGGAGPGPAGAAAPAGGGAASEAPASKGAAPKAGGGSGGSKKMLLIGGGVGALLLLTCCCLGGVGGWFFFLRGGGPPEKVMIGKWKGDSDTFKKKITDKMMAELAAALADKMELEFKDGGTFTMGLGDMKQKGQWKLNSTKGDTATLDVKYEDSGKDEWIKMEVTATDSNHLKVVERSGKKEEPMYFKRQ
jgi:hypothetical protein